MADMAGFPRLFRVIQDGWQRFWGDGRVIGVIVMLHN
jgi:hypothetical protein